MTTPHHTAGDEWLADQLLTALSTLMPLRLAAIRTASGATIDQLPDPVSYWPEERFELVGHLNITPAVMVSIGASALLQRIDIEGTEPNVPPVTVPNPVGGPVYLWRTAVQVVCALNLDADVQAADSDLADLVDDWTLTTRLRSRYADALRLSLLGNQVLVPGVLVIEENGFRMTPGGAADPSLNRRYAEVICDFTVLWSGAISRPALGWVDAEKLAVTVTASVVL